MTYSTSITLSDRELLELAAKASGYGVESCREDDEIHIKTWDHGNYTRWEPLTDDGDALRLAVRAQLELTVFRDHVTAFHATGWCDELNSGEPEAATRRAIVRAAAAMAIWRAMP